MSVEGPSCQGVGGGFPVAEKSNSLTLGPGPLLRVPPETLLAPIPVFVCSPRSWLSHSTGDHTRKEH